MKRLVWFVSGMIAGVSAFLWTRRRVEEVKRSLAPASMARRTVESGAAFGRRVREAIAVGVDVMRNGPVDATSRGQVITQRRRHIASRPNRTHG